MTVASALKPCYNCGKLGPRFRCAYHEHRHVLAQRRLRDRYKLIRKCVRCSSSDLEEGRVTCRKCRTHLTKLRNQRRHAEGHCSRCGTPLPELEVLSDRKVCKRCLVKNYIRRRKRGWR
jgi:hypothetical protein